MTIKTIMDRQALWDLAYKLWKLRAGNAKFLLGTFLDRQEASTRTSGYRRAFGVHHTPPMDHSGLRTRAADGESRKSLYQLGRVALLARFKVIAGAVADGVYTPGLLQGAEWPKDAIEADQYYKGLLARNMVQFGWRYIFFPGEMDKIPVVVLLELLEPLLDPILNKDQHGYRASKVAGKLITLLGFKSPRGSCEVVVEWAKREINRGKVYYAYGDIQDAFNSVNRDLLFQLLVQDGCPEAFGKEIIQTLGTGAYAHWKPGPKGTANEPITGIPLGSPIGPLLFNFYIKGIHPKKGETPGVGMKSYADDLFLLGSNKDQVNQAKDIVTNKVNDLGMVIEFKEVQDLRDGNPIRILKRWELMIPPGQNKVQTRKVSKEEDEKEKKNLHQGGHGGE